jgi:selenide,water dikinase
MTTNSKIRLTALASCAGCAAKMGPGTLTQILHPLINQAALPDLLVGLDNIDDAAVYRVNEHQAIISTADFFPPVVDDPYTFGTIAAANAVSDVYAMGGQVLMAINLVAWPGDLDTTLLSEILRGGRDIVAQAGGAVAGGHTVIDDEPKYGLAVTGIVHPAHILTKGGAQPGDLLVLSKPLGTGIITTAHKRDAVSESDFQAALQSMQRLNRRASEVLVQAGSSVHAVTDITGFGILGHSWEMAAQSRTSMRFDFSQLPLLPGIQHYIELGCITGGARRNETHLTPHVRLHERLSPSDREILWDPQTSGGLFAAIDPDLWPSLQAFAPEVTFWRIGEVTAHVADAAHVQLEVY